MVLEVSKRTWSTLDVFTEFELPQRTEEAVTEVLQRPQQHSIAICTEPWQSQTIPLAISCPLIHIL